jgi:large subunit ribosomal protein L9
VAVKLILREHVDHLGDRGQIVSVAPGYARNFLLPKGLALEATAGNLKMLENRRKQWAVRDLQELEQAQALAERVGTIELSVAKKAGESGTLYGSVTKPEIVELLAGQGLEVDRRQIMTDDPIKTIGDYEIPIKLHRKVTVPIKLTVVAEEAAAE